MITYTQAFLIWYLVGVVTYIITAKTRRKEVIVSDIVVSLGFGLLGFFIPIIAITDFLIDNVGTIYRRIKNKKLF
jgi:hypothetical protein